MRIDEFESRRSPAIGSGFILWLRGGIGRHVGLKIQWPAGAVGVQIPPELQRDYMNNHLK